MLLPHWRAEYRLLKLFKHYFNNAECWWELDSGSGLDRGFTWWLSQVQQIQHKLHTGKAMGNWSEDEIAAIISELKNGRNLELLLDKITQYDLIYLALGKKAIQEALDDSTLKGRFLSAPRYSYHFKTKSQDGALRDCYIGRNSEIVIVQPSKKADSAEGFPKRLVTLYRPSRKYRQSS